MTFLASYLFESVSAFSRTLIFLVCASQTAYHGLPEIAQQLAPTVLRHTPNKENCTPDFSRHERGLHLISSASPVEFIIGNGLLPRHLIITRSGQEEQRCIYSSFRFNMSSTLNDY
jgi:hypothetical protein